MSSFNLSELGNQLENAAEGSASTGVSFAKESLKLDSEEDALEVVNAIEACPNLEYLDLEGNTLGPLAAKAVGEALKKKGSSLKRALWKDMFTGRLKTEIPQALEYLGSALCTAGTRLVELDLSDNAFGPIGIKGLAAFLTSSTCYTLRELRLNNNGLGISGGKMLAKALSDCYDNSLRAGPSPLTLKVFVAGRNRLENEGAEALASVFKKLSSLEEVVMPQNGIYHPGITALAQGLSSNADLRILNLNDNTIGPKGAEALAKALPHLQYLEYLNLGDCLLKSKGCIVIAESIQGSHSSLTDINLSFNEIHRRAANSIALAMDDKECLMNLQLDGNAFGKEGRDILRKALTNSQRIGALSTLIDDDSEDESDEGDDENEDEDEDDDGEEVEEEEEEEEEENDDEDEDTVENDNDIPRIAVLQPKVSIADFLKSPTGDKLLLLESVTVQDFVEHAKNSSRDTDTSPELKFSEEFTRIVMKVSALCGSGYLDIRLKAESYTDALYSKLCAFAVENDEISIWNNALLVNLGFIKSEDKRNGKVDWNLEGCFKALEKVSQKDYFLDEIRNTLKFFLEKPIKMSRVKVVDPFQDSKDSLRTVLNCTQNT